MLELIVESLAYMICFSKLTAFLHIKRACTIYLSFFVAIEAFKNFFLVLNNKMILLPIFSCMINYIEAKYALLDNRKKLEMIMPNHFVE